MGTVLSIAEGENVRLAGNYLTHPVYGRQFGVSACEKTNPATEDGIEKYLASGVIKGIREATAKKIVKKFGKETFEVIAEEPERLTQIRGISLEKAMTISAVFHEQAQMRQSVLYLQELGITISLSMKIYQKYKQETYDVVKANPYKLAEDIFGVGFKTADSIAYKAGIPRDSPHRVNAGIIYILNRATQNGHTYLPKPQLIKESAELLEIPEEIIENSLASLQLERKIHQDRIGPDIAVYLNLYYYAEVSVAKKLLNLSENTSDESGSILRDLAGAEKITGLSLAENQKKAVKEAMSGGVLIITGGPGTGKTTTINTIIHILRTEGYSIELAAPTGRAAKRMTEATGMEAKTLHRLLEISFSGEDTDRQFFGKNAENPLEADVIIVDESSMVDILLMNNLLNAVPEGSRLILVGDVDQLPSVGPGNVLKDMIASGNIRVARLTEVFRQAQESAIIMNAHRINRGERPVFNESGKDFFLSRQLAVPQVLSTILSLVTERLPNYTNCHYLKDIQVLTPMRKSPLGVFQLNRMLQEYLNPPHPEKNEREYGERVFREGDKVMQIKNNYNLTWRVKTGFGNEDEEGQGVFNGDIGVVQSIDKFEQRLIVLFDESREAAYDFTQLEELELAYAITVHKSQGSEYRVVVMPVHSGPPMLMNRNLLYTAVTRAKELVVIVGDPKALARMVDNNREMARYTSLRLRINKLAELGGLS